MASLACAAVAGCASPQITGLPPRAPLVINNPELIRRPSAAEIARVYPAGAFEQGRDGAVELLCQPQADGALRACRVGLEQPAGLGFRTAAVRLISAIQLAAGAASEAGAGELVLVRVPITFTPPVSLPVRERPADELDPADVNFLARPDGPTLARFYPDRARELGLEGFGEIDCTVTGGGTLSGCRVAEEAPLNERFGQASVRVAEAVQLAPATKTGRATAGKRIRLKFIWLLGE